MCRNGPNGPWIPLVEASYGPPVEPPDDPRPDAFQATLAAAQRGSDRAVAELYRAFDPRLRRFLRAQEPRDFADVASETWLAAARTLHAFAGTEDQFAGWLFTITRRRLADHRRTRRRRPLDLVPDGVVDGPAARSAEEVALTGELGDERARQIVDLLPPDQAEVVLLRVVGGLDVEEVARIVGRRPGTVRVMQHRALQKLAKKLDEIGNGEEVRGDGAPRDAHTPIPPR
jgi:RNA polymerase sigma-70 factor, ECF subfamily